MDWSATLRYLSGPTADLYWPAVVTAGVLAALAAPLSVLVVLKRLAFIGQGVSHSAFAGVGLAVLMSAAGVSLFGQEGDAWVLLMAAAVGTALLISWLTGGAARRLGVEPDTAIGIVLVGTMALGFTLQHIAAGVRADRLAAGEVPPTLPSLEAILFGSILGVDWPQVWWTGAFGAAILLALWWWRRPMVMWAFDEAAAPAFGVRAGRMKVALLVMLALATVVITRLAGIVLATAVLVLPGAIGLALSDRWGRVLALSLAASLAGTVGGMVVAFELNLPPGPSIALAMVVVYALARLYRVVRPGTADAGATAPGGTRETSRSTT